jgi:hypothetical protein
LVTEAGSQLVVILHLIESKYKSAVIVAGNSAATIASCRGSVKEAVQRGLLFRRAAADCHFSCKTLRLFLIYLVAIL